MNLTTSSGALVLAYRDKAPLNNCFIVWSCVCHWWFVRSSLGGIPVGVVSVETRTMEQTIPADPANLESEVKVLTAYCCLLT